MVQDLSIGLSGWSNRVWRSSGRSPYLGTRFKLTEYPELMSAAVALQKVTAARHLGHHRQRTPSGGIKLPLGTAISKSPGWVDGWC